MKYIRKKEQQWDEYVATSGLEFDTESKQPLIKKIQIDIKEDKKEIVIQKIKDLSKES